MWRFSLALLPACVLLLEGLSADYQSAKQKVALIENDRAPAGSRISLNVRELNAYVRGEVTGVVPRGLRNPRLELGHGSASGFALIDFIQLRRAKGIPTNWFLAWLLEGERPVKVTARVRSGFGRAIVDVERVEISGMLIRGAGLDFLIRNFLLPLYPEAKIGKPFELGHRIDRLEVQPAEVRIVIRN